MALPTASVRTWAASVAAQRSNPFVRTLSQTLWRRSPLSVVSLSSASAAPSGRSRQLHTAAPTTAAATSGSNGPSVLQHDSNHPYLSTAGRYVPGFSFPAPRSLEQIVKFALLERESPQEIERIWTEFHAERDDSVAAVVHEGLWSALRERSHKK